MNVKYVSATALKRNTADLLNAVIYGGTEVMIERYGKIVAKLSPARDERREDIATRAKRSFGIIPGFPTVSASRHFRKRTLDL